MFNDGWLQVGINFAAPLGTSSLLKYTNTISYRTGFNYFAHYYDPQYRAYFGVKETELLQWGLSNIQNVTHGVPLQSNATTGNSTISSETTNMLLKKIVDSAIDVAITGASFAFISLIF